MKVSLLTAGKDRPYVLGLLSGLISNSIDVDFIGNTELQNEIIVKDHHVRYYNLRGDQSADATIIKKIIRVPIYYLKLIKYAAVSESKLFHIIWLNKFEYFDRTLLNLYYKLCGKKLIYTAHNINMKERDGNDTFINRMTLKFMYKIVDHIFVHTIKMKEQLIEEFNTEEDKVTVIPFGINNTVPKSELKKIDCRRALGLGNHDKVLLFFGNIAPYKGVEYLIEALDILRKRGDNIRLVIAGRVKECEEYWSLVMQSIEKKNLIDHVTVKSEYIPDEEVEIYFKSADVLILPYKFIFQTGVLFLSYYFGLPVIASDVGMIKEDIMIGKTGFIFMPENSNDLAEKIEHYFNCDLYTRLSENATDIIKYASHKYSWHTIGEITKKIYQLRAN